MSEGVALEPLSVPAANTVEPSVLELEDLLYDILASGGDPSLAPRAFVAVQTFLHEHARSPHSHAEFVAFFVEHGLSMQREHALDLALAPLDPRTPEPAGVSLPEAAHEFEEIEVTPVARTRALELRRGAAWAAGLALCAAIGGASYLGSWLVRREFESVRAEQRETAAALARVQAEASVLRKTLQENAELVRRVDDKSELLLQTFASPLDRTRR